MILGRPTMNVDIIKPERRVYTGIYYKHGYTSPVKRVATHTCGVFLVAVGNSTIPKRMVRIKARNYYCIGKSVEFTSNIGSKPAYGGFLK